MPLAGLRDGIITMFTVYYAKVPGQSNALTNPVACANTLTLSGLCPVNMNRTLAPVLNLFSLNVSPLEKFVNYSFQVCVYGQWGSA